MGRNKRERRARGGLTPDKFLSSGQLKKLLGWLAYQEHEAVRWGRTRPIIDNFVVNLLLETGLRASELCQLNVEDLPAAHGKKAVWIRNGKGGVERTVYIGPRTVKRLKEFCERFRAGARPKEPLLLNEGGRRMGYMSIYQKLTRIGSQVGIKLHPHMLRHTFATRLYAVKKDLRFVQDQLGHADPATTAIYAQTLPEEREATMEEFEDQIRLIGDADPFGAQQ